MTITEPDVVARSTGSRVSLRNVSHVFEREQDDLTVLSDVSFDVRAGEVVALVGQSGCGKSTILNVIGGLLSPTAGELRFDESDDDRVIAYMTQEDRLLPWRTVQKNVELPLEIAGRPRQERRAIAESLIERVGLSQFRNARPDQLSGGMRQRAAIARALTLQPTLLLLDEPFGALDAWTRNSLHELLIELQGDSGTTVVLVTHDVHEAIALSDRIITLAPRPGRLLNEYVIPPGSRPRRQQELRHHGLVEIFDAVRADLGLND